MNTIAKPTSDANEFTGKLVLVTGGTKGAGKAIAERFQRGGATVVAGQFQRFERIENTHKNEKGH